jgi:hypothetical protein
MGCSGRNRKHVSDQILRKCRTERGVIGKLVHLIGAICLTCSCNGLTLAQDSQSSCEFNEHRCKSALKHRSVKNPEISEPISENLDLAVPKATALQVVFDRKIRVRRVGSRSTDILWSRYIRSINWFCPSGHRLPGRFRKSIAFPILSRHLRP